MNLKDYLNRIHGDKEKRAALKAAVKAGKDKEFLAAEGVELPTELSDDALGMVAGGALDVQSVSTEKSNQGSSGSSQTTTVYRRDSRGNPTHWSDGVHIYHYKCPHCGRVLHVGFLNLFYCDPCDDWFNSPEIVIDQ